MTLRPGCYELEIRAGWVSIEIWENTRSVSRRILAIERASTGVMDCCVQRFGKTPGGLTFLDLDRPQTAYRTQRGLRQNFAEQFERMLSRQFPGWDITALSSGQDLRRSFSSIYPRAKLTRNGGQSMAAMACSCLEDEGRMLTFALIWHAHVCTNAATPLCLFFPEEAGTLTAHRLRWLTGQALVPRLFRFNVHGSAGEVDAKDLGNVHTQVSTQQTAAPAPEDDGQAALSFPERQLEAAVRTQLPLIDPALLLAPVHAQVLSFAAGDRDLIDLLAVSDRGHLAVLELKASEDIHLPVQALDYWMRVAWHAERGELRHLFDGIALEKWPPKLLLIAPAMSFHPAIATILRYFSPAIDVERVGVNLRWRSNLKVVLRLKGADAPISHRSSE
jgi:hypothetical protein